MISNEDIAQPADVISVLLTKLTKRWDQLPMLAKHEGRCHVACCLQSRQVRCWLSVHNTTQFLSLSCHLFRKLALCSQTGHQH